MLKARNSQAGGTTAVRYIIAAVLGGVGIYFLYEVALMTGLVPKGFTCPAPPESYQLVRVYKGDGSLELAMYTLSQDDVSKQVLQHVSTSKGDMAGAAYHRLYAQHLCKNATSGCSGVVLDVGAFIGTHALILAKMGFEVHAFEPQGIAADLMRCSVGANKFRNMKVIQEGMSNAMGQECLLPAMGALAHQTMVAPKILSKNGCAPDSRVPMVTLDHYWKDVLGSKQVDFIKIDVEGHEALVLEGGAEMFKAAPPPLVLVELYPMGLALKESTVADFLTRIYKYGYRIYNCQSQAEIKQGEGDLAIQEPTASQPGIVTDLMLVHKSKVTGDLPYFSCT